MLCNYKHCLETTYGLPVMLQFIIRRTLLTSLLESHADKQRESAQAAFAKLYYRGSVTTPAVHFLAQVLTAFLRLTHHRASSWEMVPSLHIAKDYTQYHCESRTQRSDA